MIVMNPPDQFAAGDGAAANNRPSPRKVELQGPRPTALKVNKDSYKIRKPPIHPNQQAHPAQEQQQLQFLLQDQGNIKSGSQEEQHKPVIIYAVSPKVIHTTVSDFMSIVQRLTGNTTTSASASAPSPSGGALSPAARLASIEKTANSPSGNKAKDLMMMMTTTTTTMNGDYNLDGSNNDGLLDDLLRDYCNNGSADVEIGRSQIPGILSPAPGSLLPPVSPWFFSPPAAAPSSDPFAMAGGNTLFGMSPSASGVCWSPAAILSPSPTAASLDIFNPFFDF